MAFGTGHHPTTCMCLEALEGHVDPGMKVLDLGTGSGILAIASAKLGAGDVLALDTDMVAVDAAQANCRQNRVDRRIQTFQGSLPYPLVAPKTFDLAVANITAKAIISVADHLADALVTGGTLITSGILRERQQEVEEALAKRFELGNRLYDGDWVALMAHRQ